MLKKVIDKIKKVVSGKEKTEDFLNPICARCAYLGNKMKMCDKCEINLK